MRRNPNETARDLAEKALSRLAAELQAGRNEALTDYLTAMSRFRSYSWQNVLLIAAQRPEASHVATIHAWNDLARTIQRGEKGIIIFAPGAMKQEITPLQAPGNHDLFRAAGRAMYVFDVSQTQGKPIPGLTPATGEPEESRKQLETLLAERGLDKIHTQAVAYVVSHRLRLEPESVHLDSMALYKGEKRALAESLAVIQKASAQILDKLLPEKETSAAQAINAPRHRLDSEGFARFHDQNRDRVVQSIAGLVRDRDKAEDIAARAFQAGWEKRETFRGDASPHTWIQAIARNAALESQNRERRHQFESLDGSDAREIAAPELVTDELERQDDGMRLQAALDRLPAKNRRAVIAHFIDGLSLREIARHERVPAGTIASRIHKGKQLLREAWELAPMAPQADVWLRERSSPKLERPLRAQTQNTGRNQHHTTESPEPLTWER